jgi:hypothetical protein
MAHGECEDVSVWTKPVKPGIISNTPLSWEQLTAISRLIAYKRASLSGKSGI